MAEVTGKTVQCIVVTPERAVLDERTDFVALPLFDGELGVLPGRAPLVGRLGCGELRLGQGAAVKRYFVDGGFAQVRGDVVTLLTDTAVRAQDLSADKARQAADAPAPPADAPPPQKAAVAKARERGRVQLRILGKLERVLEAT